MWGLRASAACGFVLPASAATLPARPFTSEQELTVAIDVKHVREKRAECMEVIDATMRETGSLGNQARRLDAEIAGLG
jgi:hypothetical protein